MKKLILGLSFALMGLNAVAQDSNMPATQIRDLNGKNVNFNEIVEPGKVTVISFWATWCVPCKKEIKNVLGNLDAWKKETPEFSFITISEDDARAMAQVRSYAKAQGWAFPTYLDPNNDLKRSLNFQNVPYTIIVDKQGKIAFMHSGYEEGGEAEVYAKVKELAAK